MPGSADGSEHLNRFHWEPQPRAFAWLVEFVRRFRVALPDADAWANQLYSRSGNRFIDLIDTVYPGEMSLLESAQDAGWQPVDPMHGHRIFRNPEGVFPDLVVPDAGFNGQDGIDLKVDEVEDFFLANGVHASVEGSRSTRYRRATVYENPQARLGVTERLGFDGAVAGPAVDIAACLETLDAFRNRDRDCEEEAGFTAASGLIDSAVTAVGVDAACALFFRAEREYWQTRNAAARAQYQRQQRLGIGWANHDHHTYRSSRLAYAPLIACLEKLGMRCRERFFPGPGAGWGAQVLEQAVTRIVVFADVDMSADELHTDFPHIGLAERDELGTVGLWCALHGESFLQAGMHHLECMFDFQALASQLKAEAGIGMMKPFSDFDHLKQQFTQGEHWPVDRGRVERLLASGQITAAQAEQFHRDGAIGSHLENLERNDGFKGFNQSGIDAIISETDPRNTGI